MKANNRFRKCFLIFINLERQQTEMSIDARCQNTSLDLLNHQDEMGAKNNMSQSEDSFCG